MIRDRRKHEVHRNLHSEPYGLRADGLLDESARHRNGDQSPHAACAAQPLGICVNQAGGAAAAAPVHVPQKARGFRMDGTGDVYRGCAAEHPDGIRRDLINQNSDGRKNL